MSRAKAKQRKLFVMMKSCTATIHDTLFMLLTCHSHRCCPATGVAVRAGLTYLGRVCTVLVGHHHFDRKSNDLFSRRFNFNLYTFMHLYTAQWQYFSRLLVVEPPVWWGLLCTCTLDNPALVAVSIESDVMSSWQNYHKCKWSTFQAVWTTSNLQCDFSLQFITSRQFDIRIEKPRK